MTTKSICTTDTFCTDQIYRQTNANQESEKSVWAGLRWLAATIGEDMGGAGGGGVVAALHPAY